MIFPWCIDGAATALSGIVSYSIQFFIVEENAEEYKYLYNLGTGVTQGEVLYGLEVSQISNDFDISSDAYH